MSISEDYTYIFCDGDGCDAKIKNHAWRKIKASSWFFSKDNERAYCPNHLPEWIVEFRRKK